ncbi:ABC transporter substrate-binding protein [Aquipseudomonas campi]|uniref:ABC transporter substrate-binding protein n=1 Tax=Aquipseudomonas campi TaxID=2731681 RepID=A0A6M8FNT3_9GAMM|nr:GGDEF domain-containing protein [Pseudomonas campi]QKE62358.1 ABC transporter substrate-binding protein [Pseudomonas campi]
MNGFSTRQATRPTVRATLIRGLCVLVLCLPGLAISAEPSRHNDATALQVIDFQLRWKHQFQFAGYYAAIAQGYYREEGFEVRLHEGAPGRTPVDEVLAGRAQYAESNSELLYERLKGKPLVALAVIFQHSPSVLLARADAGIENAHDLIGKNVMLMNAQTDADFQAMFRREGIDPALIQLQPSSYDIEDLVSGKVAAFNSYLTNEPYHLQQRGIDYRIISPNTYGIDFYSDILFTSEAELRDNPERVEAFRRATLRGWRYAMDNPEEIIDLLLAQYQVKKSRAHLQFEAEAMRGLILPDLIEIGHMNPGRWQRMAEAFHELGMVSDTRALEGFVYDPTPLPQVERLQKIIVLISVGAGLILLATLALLASQRRLRREIQRRQVAEEEVRNLAFHDSLTGLPNRNSFIPYAKQKLLSAKRNGECLALCYIDLNRFKQINDAHGHQAGDAILIHTAKAISAHIREADMAARMGGDEFVILLDGVHNDADIQQLTAQICRAIALPLRWADAQLQVSASLGVALYPRDGEELDELMSKADSAMFLQKSAMLVLR